MLEIHLYLSNLETYEHFAYLSIKYKDWSTTWDIYFEYKLQNSNKNSNKLQSLSCPVDISKQSLDQTFHLDFISKREAFLAFIRSW